LTFLNRNLQTQQTLNQKCSLKHKGQIHFKKTVSKQHTLHVRELSGQHPYINKLLSNDLLFAFSHKFFPEFVQHKNLIS
jgi:hypothetical protein